MAKNKELKGTFSEVSMQEGGVVKQLEYRWSGEIVFEDKSIELPYPMRYHYVVNSASWDQTTLTFSKKITVTVEPVR